MIEIEIKRPDFEARDDDVVWEPVAWLSVNGERYDLNDPHGVIDFDRHVLDAESGLALTWTDDKEAWARHLGATYRGPELVAVVVRDSEGEQQEEQLERQPVAVPEAAREVFGEYAHTR